MFTFRRRPRQNYGLYLLAVQLFSARYIPPITLSAILLQIAIFLGYIPMLGPRMTEAMCLLPSRVLYRSEWLRMLASVFMHADDMHLYFNMVSLLWKGRRLEPLLGSRHFLLMLIVFAVLTSGTMVGLSYLIDEVLEFSGANFMNQCAVGFSGVLFALKVVHTTYFPYSDHYLLGWLPIPSKYACWAELFLLQMVTPNASFIGHLSGILVGLTYTVGPLKKYIKILEDTFLSPFGTRHSQRRSEARQQHESTSGSSRNQYEWWRDGRNFNQYTAGLSEEEQLWQAVRSSLEDYNPSHPYYSSGATF